MTDSKKSAVDFRTSVYEKMKVNPTFNQITDGFYPTDSLSKRINKPSLYQKNDQSSTQSIHPSLYQNNDQSSIQSIHPSNACFDIMDSPTDQKGRRAIANQPIAQGQLIVRESARPSVIRAQFAHVICGRCLKICDQSNDQSSNHQCQACESIVYCSIECMIADLGKHRLECSALAESPSLAINQSIDIDLIRATIAYIIQHTMDQSNDQSNNQANNRSNDVSDFQSSWDDVDAMIANSESINQSSLQSMKETASAILNQINQSVEQSGDQTINLSINQLVDFMCRINSNAHGLMASIDDSINQSINHPLANQSVGFGLFPLCSILNHSCSPNCTFVNENNHLIIRSNQSINQSTELTVNYVSIYQSMIDRRIELSISKSFICDCQRCCSQPTTQEELKRFINDQYVNGILCRSNNQSNKCFGIYRLLEPLIHADVLRKQKKKEKEKEKKRKAKQKQKANKQIDSSVEQPNEQTVDQSVEQPVEQPTDESEQSNKQSNKQSNNQSNNQSEDINDQLIVGITSRSQMLQATSWFPNDVDLFCSHCGDRIRLIDCRDIEIDWLIKVEVALKAYTDESNNQTLEQSYDTLNRLRNELRTVFHSSHGLIHLMTPAVVNVLGQLITKTNNQSNNQSNNQNTRKWIQERRNLVAQLAKDAEACFPSHFVPLMNYFETEAASLKSEANQLINQSNNQTITKLHPSRPLLLARLKRLERVQAIAKVAHGTQSPEFTKAKRMVEEAEKAMK